MNERTNNVCTTLIKGVTRPGLVRLTLNEIYLFEEYY